MLGGDHRPRRRGGQVGADGEVGVGRDRSDLGARWNARARDGHADRQTSGIRRRDDRLPRGTAACGHAGAARDCTALADEISRVRVRERVRSAGDVAGD